MKIKQLDLYTSNIDAMISFYQQLLQLPVQAKENELTITIGQTMIRFHKSDVASHPFYHFAINIPANKIEEARDWMNKKAPLMWMEDYKNVIADFKSWNAQSVYFVDAAGNIVELIARFDLSTNTVENFGPSHLLSVSEIGLVFKQEEIEQRTNSILGNYQLDYFEKQKPFPDFKAVGNDEGLFIIATEGRNWYPTQLPAKIFPTKITFEVKGIDYTAHF